jgi:hypothetical protein
MLGWPSFMNHTPTLCFYVAPAGNMVGRIPLIPCFWMVTRLQQSLTCFPAGCADTAAEDGRCGSNVYELTRGCGSLDMDRGGPSHRTQARHCHWQSPCQGLCATKLLLLLLILNCHGPRQHSVIQQILAKVPSLSQHDIHSSHGSQSTTFVILFENS